jgi:hypothetical protein
LIVNNGKYRRIGLALAVQTKLVDLTVFHVLLIIVFGSIGLTIAGSILTGIGAAAAYCCSVIAPKPKVAAVLLGIVHSVIEFPWIPGVFREKGILFGLFEVVVNVVFLIGVGAVFFTETSVSSPTTKSVPPAAPESEDTDVENSEDK